MAQKIIAILEEFNKCAQIKKQRLQNCRNSLSNRFRKGETDSVLHFIGQNLARDSADGIFIGTIEDYIKYGLLIALKDLCESIDLQIEAC